MPGGKVTVANAGDDHDPHIAVFPKVPVLFSHLPDDIVIHYVGLLRVVDGEIGNAVFLFINGLLDHLFPPRCAV